MAIFFIQDIYKITGIGIILVGQVRSGVLKLGMRLKLHLEMTIKLIEMNHMHVKEAKEGDNVGIALTNWDLEILKSLVRKDVEFF